MANHSVSPLFLREDDREKLFRLMRSTSVRAGLAQRARIVLLVAEKVGATRTTVIAWRARYDAARVEELADHEKPGRPRRIDQRAIVAATLGQPPRNLGLTHWSSRLLAGRLGIDNNTVAKA